MTTRKSVHRDKCFLALSWGHSDPAVAIACDGKIVAFVEEERLCRVKHAYGQFPRLALQECLALAGLNLDDIAAIAVNWDLARFENGEMEGFYSRINSSRAPTQETLRWQRKNLHTYTSASIQNELRQQFRTNFGHNRVPPICSFGHHYVHAWQSAHMSGFTDSVVLVMDGSGDDLASSVWLQEEDSLTPLSQIPIPDSIGWFYAAVTELLGFSAYDGEHKVMAMAAYGKPNPALDEAFSQVLQVSGDSYLLNPKYIHDGNHTFSNRFTDALPDLIGIEPKLASTKFRQEHFDIAHAAQQSIAKAALSVLAPVLAQNRERALCLSGGVALNVSLGYQLQKMTGIEKIFSNPLGNDSGAAVGTALLASGSKIVAGDSLLNSLLLGRKYSGGEIGSILTRQDRISQCLHGRMHSVIQLLLQGKLVGWFQGKAEAGPRALGCRSILCDPRNMQSINRLTRDIKHREPWQPYGLSMPESNCHQYLSYPVYSLNMSIAVPTTQELQVRAPNAVHADGTVRPHIVTAQYCPELFALLQLFGEQSGLFCLINTSLNRKR